MTNKQLRELAKARGDKFFTPARPCRKGHSVYYVKSNNCAECVKAGVTRYRLYGRHEAYHDARDVNRVRRAEAQERGDVTFISALKCSRGHDGEWYVAGNGCAECMRTRTRRRHRLKRILCDALGIPLRKRNVRQVASDCGDEFYDTGRPCASGHIAERRTSSGKCLECERIDGGIRRCGWRTPPWADKDAIREFYHNRPEGHHIDHIIPLKGDSVCGLHVIDNLQYLSIPENLAKKNFFEPIVEAYGRI